jgi:hypothetical protein
MVQGCTQAKSPHGYEIVEKRLAGGKSEAEAKKNYTRYSHPIHSMIGVYHGIQRREKRLVKAIDEEK